MNETNLIQLKTIADARYQAFQRIGNFAIGAMMVAVVPMVYGIFADRKSPWKPILASGATALLLFQPATAMIKAGITGDVR